MEVSVAGLIHKRQTNDVSFFFFFFFFFFFSYFPQKKATTFHANCLQSRQSLFYDKKKKKKKNKGKKVQCHLLKILPRMLSVSSLSTLLTTFFVNEVLNLCALSYFEPSSCKYLSSHIW